MKSRIFLCHIICWPWYHLLATLNWGLHEFLRPCTDIFTKYNFLGLQIYWTTFGDRLGSNFSYSCLYVMKNIWTVGRPLLICYHMETMVLWFEVKANWLVSIWLLYCLNVPFYRFMRAHKHSFYKNNF